MMILNKSAIFSVKAQKLLEINWHVIMIDG